MTSETVDNTQPSGAAPEEQPSGGGFLRRLGGLLQDAAVYGMGGALSQLVNFLLLPLYTRFLTPEDYGVMAMLAIVNVVYQPLAQVGMRAAVFRFYALAKSPDERQAALTTGAASIAATSIALMALGLVGAGLIGRAIGNEASVGLIRLTLVASMFSTLAEAPYAALRASRRVKMAAGFNLASLLMGIAASIFFVAGLELGVLGVVLGTLVGESLTAVALYAATHDSFRMLFDAALWKSMLRWGAPFLPHHLLATGVDYFGIYMVGMMLGAGEQGLYRIAMMLATPLTFAVNTIQKAWVAYKFHIYSQDQEPKQVFRSIVTYYFAGISYLWVGIALWSPELLRLMTTPAFHAAGPLIAMVALVSVARGMYFMLGTGLEFSENTKGVPLISLVGLVTTVVAAFVWVERLGAVGAAVATTLGWVAMATMFYYLSYRRFPIRYDWGTLVALSVAAVACVVAGYFGQALPPLSRIAAGVGLSLAYPAAALVILSRSSSERERILHLLKRARRATG
jgi:O-antigen/teichoic acid export membrane protein